MKSRTKILIILFFATIFSTFGIIASVKNKSIKDSIKEKEQVSLIPRKVLFDNPEKIQVKISPNGKWLSYLAPYQGVLNVWIEKVSDKSSKKIVTHNQHRAVHSYSWAFDNQHIIYSDDKNGDENWRVYSVAIDTLDKKALAEVDNVQANVVASSYQFPEEIVIGLNQRRADFHDLYRINIKTAERKLLFENNEFAEFVLNEKLELCLGWKITDTGGAEWYYLKDVNKKILNIDQDDVVTTSSLGLNETGKILYLLDSRNRDTAALTAFNLQTLETSLIAADQKADILDVLIHPVEKNIQAFAATYDRKKWQTIDQSLQKDFDYLTTLTAGELEITSRSLDDKYWIVAFVSDQGAPHYYHYDRAQKKANFLFSGNTKLDAIPLVKMKSVVIPSRDDLSLVSYVSLPSQITNQTLQPSSPVPLILIVHGGPHARDNWGYSPFHQWLANRGYAVLSVNYRGSTGFGKQFLNASYGEWAGKMHDDLIDAVNWAIQEGITTKEQVAIMGGSYGGYATLVGLTFTPDTFACGVDIVGRSNLKDILNSIPPYWKPAYSLLKRRMGGDPETAEGQKFLASRSPLNFVDNIKKPLLIGHGANDPRIKQIESDQIVKAMQEKHIPVTYILYPDEGHGFKRPENRLSFYAVTEAFLAKVLKGRFEPIGEDFQNSSIDIKVGKENIPGL